jgi:hypothetical protein
VAKLHRRLERPRRRHPEGRKLATLLLSTLGWIKDAAPFLPLEK